MICLRMCSLAFLLACPLAAYSQGTSVPVPRGFTPAPASPAPELASDSSRKLLSKPANDALDKPLVRFIQEKAPLQKVLDDFARAAGVTLSVNWKTIELTDLRRETPVSINLDQVPARRALKSILDTAGSGMVNLAFLVDNNQVLISTQEDLRSPRYQIMRIYDISFAFADVEPDSQKAGEIANRILETLKTTIAPDTWRDNGGTIGSARILNGRLIVSQSLDLQDSVEALVDALRQGGTQSTRAYDVSDLVKDDKPPPPDPNHIFVTQPRTKMDNLIDTIETTCGRDTWRDRGGRTSSIAPFEGKLYVTTSPAVHQQIQDLLALMRK